MIDFKFTINIDGVERGLHALADSLEDVTVPLLRTGGHIRARARRRFDSEGDGTWPALADATVKRKFNAARVALLENSGRGKPGARSMVQRVARDAEGAGRWQAKESMLRDAVAKARASGKRTKGLEARAERARVQSETRLRKIADKLHFARRAGVVSEGGGTYAGIRELIEFSRREVERAKRHGGVQRAYKALKAAGYGFSDEERRRMLRQGARRYRASEASTKMLGGLADTLGMKVDGGALAVYSKAYISGIHNDGGTAGNNANIKQREFLTLDDSDFNIFVEALREAAIEAWAEA